ncbi:hypothetical protein ACFV9G_04100 [Nocardioides sp. NPDC059952]|uniref:hypothetical protein n=1 Tax=Nocardioides sp. NPDC059952 TaxID=3347014 RepID=UPI00365A00EB
MEEALTCQGKVVSVDLSAGQAATEGDDVIWAAAVTSGTIDGLGGNDTICGPDGNHGSSSAVIYGGDGDDAIESGHGRDVHGGPGNDTINGGNSKVYGEGGADQITGTSSTYMIFGGEGDDAIHAQGASTWGDDGNDSIYCDDEGTISSFRGGAGSDRIDCSGSYQAALYGDGDDDVLTGGGELRGGPGADALTAHASGSHLYGGPGDDTVSGGSGRDWIVLEPTAGADLIHGSGSVDTLDLRLIDAPAKVDLAMGVLDIGGTVATVTGIDAIFGSGYDDVLIGSAADESFQGGAGRDQITGSGGADVIHGDEGDDALIGGDGNDMVRGHDGADRLVGGVGDDVVIGEVADAISDESGNDVVDFADSEVAIRYDAGTRTVSAGDRSQQVSGFEGVVGSTFDDVLNGSEGVDTLFGGAGQDTIDGRDGDDVLDHQDALPPGLTAYEGRDTTAGDDHVAGGPGADLLGSVVPTADTLIGGDGDDQMWSSKVALPGSGADVVHITYGEGWVGEVSYADVAGPVSVNLTGSTGSIAVSGAGNDVITSDVRDWSPDLRAFTGSPAADVIVGTSMRETLAGGAGNDTIKGGSGNDVLRGGVGDDTLDGGYSTDWLDGGPGDDHIDGGPGTEKDRVSYESAPTAVTVDLNIDAPIATVGGGTDEIVRVEDVTGSAYDDTLTALATGSSLDGGDGMDLLKSGPGDDWFSDSTSIVSFEAADGPVVMSVDSATGHGNDYVGNYRRIVGTNHDDDIELGSIACGADGGPGSDHLTVMSSWNHCDEHWDLDGGDGDDTFVIDPDLTDRTQVEVRGGPGIDTVSFAETQASAPKGVRYVVNGPVSALGHQMTKVGASTTENVIGTSGRDYLTGDAGVNRIDGGSGDDDVAGAGGRDSLDGGEGTDTVSYHTEPGPVRVDLSEVGGPVAPDTLSGLEGVIGSNYDDKLTGDSGANALRGGRGDDVIDGGAGDDVIAGDEGRDTASFASATAGVRASAATQVSAARGAGDDELVSIEDLEGSAYDDKLTGDGGSNTLSGGAGNDTLAGVGGSDVVLGGAGDDDLSGGDGDDALRGDSGNDRVTGGNGIDRASFSTATSAVRANMTSTSGGAGTDSMTTVEALTGSKYSDTLTGGSGADSLAGDAGDDTLVGGHGNDRLSGGSGNDTFRIVGNTMPTMSDTSGSDHIDLSQRGTGAYLAIPTGIEKVTGTRYADRIVGNSGANYIQGGAGNDTIYGKSGNDSISGGDGNDVIDPGTGNDSISGGGGTDKLTYASATARVTVRLNTTAAQGTGGSGTERISSIESLTGSSYSDTLIGNSSANVLSGGAGNDTIRGGGGNDYVDGGVGHDKLYGDSGDDRLFGSTGYDYLYGGVGRDYGDGGPGADHLYGIERRP